jgi:hypothetical protein
MKYIMFISSICQRILVERWANIPNGKVTENFPASKPVFFSASTPYKHDIYISVSVFAKYIGFEIEHKKTEGDMNKNHFHSTRTKHRYWVYYRNIYIMFVRGVC